MRQPKLSSSSQEAGSSQSHGTLPFSGLQASSQHATQHLNQPAQPDVQIGIGSPEGWALSPQGRPSQAMKALPQPVASASMSDAAIGLPLRFQSFSLAGRPQSAQSRYGPPSSGPVALPTTSSVSQRPGDPCFASAGSCPAMPGFTGDVSPE